METRVTASSLQVQTVCIFASIAAYRDPPHRPLHSPSAVSAINAHRRDDQWIPPGVERCGHQTDPETQWGCAECKAPDIVAV